MKITRNNYEAWLLDYIEGNLTQEQRGDLLVFLSNNPDLQVDFEFDEGAFLAPYRADAQPLDQSGFRVEDGFSSQEEWLAAVAEGDVKGPLADAARSDQALGRVLAQYEKIRLQPSLAAGYPNKGDLHRVTVVRSIFTPLARLTAAAAILVIILGAAWALFQQPQSAQMAIVNDSTLQTKGRLVVESPTVTEEVVEPQRVQTAETVRGVAPTSDVPDIQRSEDSQNVAIVAPLLPLIINENDRLMETISREPVAHVVNVPEVPSRIEPDASVEEEDFAMVIPDQNAPTYTVTQYLVRQAQTRVLGVAPSSDANVSRAMVDRALEKISTGRDVELAYVAPSPEQPRSFKIKLGKFEIER